MNSASADAPQTDFFSSLLVAVKVLTQRLSGDSSALERFEREAKAVAALSHPNILAIHDYGKTGDLAYAVMELLEAERLDPKSPVTCYAIGTTSLAANRPGLAVDTITRLSPTGDFFQSSSALAVWPPWVLSAAYHMLGNYERELAVADNAVRRFPDALAAQEGRVRALAALGRVEDVRRTVDEGLAATSPRGGTPNELMMQTAAELHAHGNREAGLQMAARAVKWLRERPPGERADPACIPALANALYAAERWEDARALFEKLSAGHPAVRSQAAQPTTQGAGMQESESSRLSTAISYLGPLGAIAAAWETETRRFISPTNSRRSTRSSFSAHRPTGAPASPRSSVTSRARWISFATPSPRALNTV